MSIVRAFATLAIAASIAGAAYAQQYVFPAKGQSPEQQKKDEGDCHAWAVGQTGFDPAKPPPAAAAPQQPKTATGTTPGAGARGAVRGAAVGEIVGGDARTGAAAGAIAARGQSRRQNVVQEQQSAQAQQQATGSQ